MKQRSNRLNIMRRIVVAVRRKWRLADERDEALFQLRLRDAEIVDLKDRLEAYKDQLVALNRHDRLEGVALERRIQQLMGPLKQGA